MIALFISSTLLILLAASGAVWMIHHNAQVEIGRLVATNKDLLDRALGKAGQPPSGVDLTEKYEEKTERERERRDNPKLEKNSPGPIEKLTAKWAKDDRNKADRLNIDATKPRHYSN